MPPIGQCHCPDPDDCLYGGPACADGEERKRRRATQSESTRSITVDPVDFVCLKEPRCKAPCGGRNCHVAPSAGLSISSDMAARMEILARRLKDCDYPDRGTIQCGTAGNANLVRYNGEDIVGCAHVYDERDRLLLGWLAENAPRILEALSTRSATERRGVTFDAERYYREYRDGLYGVGWQRDETTSHEHVDSLEATVNAALNVHGGFLIVPVGPGTTEGERG